MSESIGPRIDDAYWFEWSKEHLDTSLERRDAALATLQKLVLWLWGIYTSFAAVGFALSERALDPRTAGVIGTASVLLIAVYWASVWGQMPVAVEFDPRSPTEISEARATIIKEKDLRLYITMILSLIAAAAVAVALLAAGAVRGGDQPRLQVAADPVSESSLSPASDSTMSVAVTARIAAETRATLDVTIAAGTDDERTEPPRTFLSTEEGLVQVSVPVSMARTYRVTVTWQDGDVQHAMSHLLTMRGSGSR